MRIITLLNQVYYLKSFVYKNDKIEEVDGMKAFVVDIIPRKNSKVVCPICKLQCPTYDHQKKPRLYEFIPIWGMKVYFRYLSRRSVCFICGVHVELIPWAEGKNHLTKAFQIFLAKWARRLSWKETAEIFQTSWDSVFRSVKSVVAFGLKHRRLDNITAIGVDEWQYSHGHKYLTLVYQLNDNMKRLLFVTKDRTKQSLHEFFDKFGEKRSQQLKYVCTDMWRKYLDVIAERVPAALNILDRFHIVQNLNKAVNKVRIAEARFHQQEGYEAILKHTKYCFLKRRENLTSNQEYKLKDVLRYDLKSVRAYLLKESFQLFWSYKNPYWAEWYLKKWCTRAMRSRLDPIKKFVKMLRNHQPLLMNWFKAKKAYSSGSIEGLNRKINLVTRKSYGFRSYEILKIALFHTMGDLPEPELTHRFC
ncbi:MAG: ISL3 family transposase [Deltaproteobacteria bacterium]|nr:ISL3 family transposase [Deltaproteobacteria bacterium]MBT4527709.1 ISL3 family transposase [Deltaproteobacteria bacterium]MBT6764404.1 ISL3 family transposase [Prolixibacteraceae bacterium]